MKKIILSILVVVLTTSVFLYDNYQQEQRNIIKQKQEIDYLVKLLEKLYIAAKVECSSYTECFIENGVFKYFKFSNIYIKNRVAFYNFLQLLEKDFKDLKYSFIEKNNLEYYFDKNKYYFDDTSLFNMSSEFEFNVDNLKFNDNVKDDLAFLSWYLNKTAYKSVLDMLNDISIDFRVKYSVVNNAIDYSKIATNLQINLSNTSKISFKIRNKKIEFKIENFDLIKIIFIEFKEIIKPFLKNNENIIFFESLFTHYDEIINPKIKSVTFLIDNIYNTKNVLFSSTYKLESN
ncbi:MULTISPECIES: hypothetical protein [unclassified Campylobacter]|uniref:hypothetical protein n=1 Tax=unclassified Campylobacter TaxID=2593542 RepID=UPI001EFAD777|nr:hypothetical protein [Campylobacter sp. RM12651]MBZ7976140.1 hypothetical protein [Campylobacter sp. RM12637]ULO03159.1 hypothetical protein AVBRAN_0694 [Campylobacter sp. RM12651]